MRAVNSKIGTPPGRFRYDWDPLVERGKANPGVWIETTSPMKHSLYAVLVRGGNSKFPPDEWEFGSSNTHSDINGKRMCTLKFRYVGHQRKKKQ